jgi:hypothetical protein
MNKLPIDANQLAAVVLFGNPFHISGAPQNRCSGASSFQYYLMSSSSNWLIKQHWIYFGTDLWFRACFNVCAFHSIRVRSANLRLLLSMGHGLPDDRNCSATLEVRRVARRGQSGRLCVISTPTQVRQKLQLSHSPDWARRTTKTSLSKHLARIALVHCMLRNFLYALWGYALDKGGFNTPPKSALTRHCVAALTVNSIYPIHSFCSTDNLTLNHSNPLLFITVYVVLNFALL